MGAIADNANKGKFTISTSNLVEGISKEEYHAYADMPVQASYSRSMETRQGGYISKQLNAAFQTIVLDIANSDCNSRKTMKVLITNANKERYTYRYILKGNKLVLLDDTILNSVVDTVVQMRSPMFCLSDRVCSKCAGELYYKLGINNVGLLTTRIGSSIMNLALN